MVGWRVVVRCARAAQPVVLQGLCCPPLRRMPAPAQPSSARPSSPQITLVKDGADPRVRERQHQARRRDDFMHGLAASAARYAVVPSLLAFENHEQNSMLPPVERRPPVPLPAQLTAGSKAATRPDAAPRPGSSPTRAAGGSARSRASGPRMAARRPTRAATPRAPPSPPAGGRAAP